MFVVLGFGNEEEFPGQDLNLRPPGYEPGELPLLHPGMNFGSVFCTSLTPRRPPRTPDENGNSYGSALSRPR